MKEQFHNMLLNQDRATSPFLSPWTSSSNGSRQQQPSSAVRTRPTKKNITKPRRKAATQRRFKSPRLVSTFQGGKSNGVYPNDCGGRYRDGDGGSSEARKSWDTAKGDIFCRSGTRSRGRPSSIENVSDGDAFGTIETIMAECGKSLIHPSAVSKPMDFLTSEPEYHRVWQVGEGRSRLGLSAKRYSEGRLKVHTQRVRWSRCSTRVHSDFENKG